MTGRGLEVPPGGLRDRASKVTCPTCLAGPREGCSHVSVHSTSLAQRAMHGQPMKVPHQERIRVIRDHDAVLEQAAQSARRAQWQVRYAERMATPGGPAEEQQRLSAWLREHGPRLFGMEALP